MPRIALLGNNRYSKEIGQVLVSLYPNIRLKNDDLSYMDNCYYYMYDNYIVWSHKDRLSEVSVPIKCMTYQEFNSKWPHRIGDTVLYHDDVECIVTEMHWEPSYETVHYVVKSKEVGDETHCKVDELSTIEYDEIRMNSSNKRIWAGNGPNMIEIKMNEDQGIRIIDGRTYIVRKNKYPTSYKECVEIMGEGTKELHKIYDDRQLATLYELLLCRDAYWKIDNWKPDWTSVHAKYVINVVEDYIEHDGHSTHSSYMFAFPTSDARDAFYENFRTKLETIKSYI